MAILLTVTLSSTHSPKATTMPRTLTPAQITADLDAHLTRVARRRARRGLPAPQVRVEAPGLLYRFGDQQTPFHSASVGKLGTAALIAQEISAGTLTLDTRIADILGSETDGLFREPGATIEHLLGHTSGAADYFDDGTTHGPSLKKLIVTEPDHHWTADELLAFTRERQRPVGRPGERFHYTDTGYVLLGRALEVITGRDAFELTRERIFAPAGMNDSVVWLREVGPERISPIWLDGVEISAAESLTVDWMGGGYVTTIDDLARFTAAMTDGTLVDPELWSMMCTPRSTFRAGIRYGLGAMQLDFRGFSPFLGQLGRPVGHLGVLSVHAFADPVVQTNVVLNFHGTREMRASFMTHIRIAQRVAQLA